MLSKTNKSYDALKKIELEQQQILQLRKCWEQSIKYGEIIKIAIESGYFDNTKDARKIGDWFKEMTHLMKRNRDLFYQYESTIDSLLKTMKKV